MRGPDHFRDNHRYVKPKESLYYPEEFYGQDDGYTTDRQYTSQDYERRKRYSEERFIPDRNKNPQVYRDFDKDERRDRKRSYEDRSNTSHPRNPNRRESSERYYDDSYRSEDEWRSHEFKRQQSYNQAPYPREHSHRENRGNHQPARRPPRIAPSNRSLEHRWEMDQKKIKKTRGQLAFSYIYNLAFYTITIGIILMALMFSFSSKGNASIFGYRFYNVLTNSMVPQADSPKGGFYAGDIVVLKMMSGDKVKDGDVVTFAVGDGGRYLTHRMVKRLDELNGEKGDYIVTKGDANKTNDPPIEAERIIGKVIFAIPKVGSILDFIRSEFWLCLLVIISTFAFFIVLKSYLMLPNEPSKKYKSRRV